MIIRSAKRLTSRELFDFVLAPSVVIGLLCSSVILVPTGAEPIVLSILVGVLFLWALKIKNNGVFPIEIGSVYFGIVFLYCTMPFVGFALNGFKYHIFSSSRLFEANPTPEEVRHIGYYYVLYLFAFSFSYLALRKTSKPHRYRCTLRPHASVIVFLAIIYVLFEAPVIWLKFDTLGQVWPEDYSQQYLWANEYPLLVRQILNHWQAITFTLQVFILTYLFLIYRKVKIIIAGLLSLKLLSLLFLLGARTETALLFAAAVICYYNYVRRFSLIKAFITSLIFVGIFLFIGWGRDLQNIPIELLGSFFPSTEFESLFANAFDLYSMKQADSLDIPDLYPFEGVLNLFPQQLLPIEKPSLSNWYVRTYYRSYAEAGGGYAFGVISEAMLSDSAWFSVFWRGAFHGAVLAWIYSLFHGSYLKPVQIATYVWLTILSYKMFRDTTFSLLPMVVFDLLPVIAIIYVIPLIAKPTRVIASR